VCLLERCAFLDLQSAIIGSEKEEASAVHLLDCTFENTPVADSRMRTSDDRGAKFPIRVRGGSARIGAAEWTQEERSAAWGAAFVAEWNGVSFEPGTPRATLQDLLQVLDGVAPRSGETPVRIAVEAVGRGGPESFVVSFRDDERGTGRHVLLRRTPAGWEEGEFRGGRPWIPPVEETRGALSLAAVARMSGLPPETAALSVAFGRPYPVAGSDPVPSVSIEAGRSWTRWILHGVHGGILHPQQATARPAVGAGGGRGGR
jgi:hypothetical protein